MANINKRGLSCSSRYNLCLRFTK